MTLRRNWIAGTSICINLFLLFMYKNQLTIHKCSHFLSKEKAFSCDDSNPETKFSLRGKYYVLYNYIKASKSFRCDQSITYTTHADFTFLDNLIPLLERWHGPVSIAIYAPGTDFGESLKRIQCLRECSGSSIVKELVTFHVFFDQNHLPNTTIPQIFEELPVVCDDLDPVALSVLKRTYIKSMNLSYPINVGRNVAKEMATTHYVLPSDIELYPSINLISTFLEMIRSNDTVMQNFPPRVFVLPVFEVEATVKVLPNKKQELVQMLRNGSAVSFHKHICGNCHRIPKGEQWPNAQEKQGLDVFVISKRHKPFHHWEPFYIGTKLDPMYDERLSWDGRRDKMLQGYILCLLDYDFNVLDNAFLVHRPGIKQKSLMNRAQKKAQSSQASIIFKKIVPQLNTLFDCLQQMEHVEEDVYRTNLTSHPQLYKLATEYSMGTLYVPDRKT